MYDPIGTSQNSCNISLASGAKRKPQVKRCATQPNNTYDEIERMDDTDGANLDVPNGQMNGHNSDGNSEEDKEEWGAKYGAQYVSKCLTSISLCTLIVLATISWTKFFKYTDLRVIISVFVGERKKLSIEKLQRLIYFIIGVAAFIKFIYFLCKKGFTFRLIQAYAILLSFLLLTGIGFLYFRDALRVYNVAMDWFTCVAIVWNFGIVGTIALNYQSPSKLKEAYLIFFSALLTLDIIVVFPNCAIWTFLASTLLLAAFKCFEYSTFTPMLKDPMEVLIQQISLVFSLYPYISNYIYDPAKREYSYNLKPVNSVSPTGTNGTPSAKDDRVAYCRNKVKPVISHNGQRFSRYRIATQHNKERLSRIGINLTELQEMGRIVLVIKDCSLFSLLVAKALTYGDLSTTIACFVATLVGSCLSIVMLVIWRKPYDGYPISIFFGLFFYIATSAICTPFVEELSEQQTFI